MCSSKYLDIININDFNKHIRMHIRVCVHVRTEQTNCQMLLIGEDYIGFVVIFLQVFCSLKLSNIKGKSRQIFLDLVSLCICTAQAFRINYLEVLTIPFDCICGSMPQVTQSCLTLQIMQGPQPTRLLYPWYSPGKEY